MLHSVVYIEVWTDIFHQTSLIVEDYASINSRKLVVFYVTIMTIKLVVFYVTIMTIQSAKIDLVLFPSTVHTPNRHSRMLYQWQYVDV